MHFFSALDSKFCFLGQGFCLFVLRTCSEICGQFFFARGAYVASSGQFVMSV